MCIVLCWVGDCEWFLAMLLGAGVLFAGGDEFGWVGGCSAPHTFPQVVHRWVVYRRIETETVVACFSPGRVSTGVAVIVLARC